MRNYLLVASICAVALCSGCSEEDLGASDPNTNEFTFDGYIQKGPFITGTSVEVKELDESLNSTGKTFSTQITNDFGGFNITCNSDQPYAELIADGYYFDEVEGELSEGKLTLRAISKMDQSTNINILTTLQTDRMRSLIKDGKGFDEAFEQSKEEVLGIFNISEDEVVNFNNMNITEQGLSNSILLAISSILQYDRGVAEMSELISKLSLDIADNGIVDNTTLTDKIVESSKGINSAEIIRNLEERYSDLGEKVTIDNFYDFIDSDGDGVLNGGNPYLFIDKSDYTYDYVTSQQAVYFNSNYTPEVNIVSDDSFIKVVSIEGAKVILELSANDGMTKRTAELQFLSADSEVVESVFIEQASSYTELEFNLIFGITTRSTLPNSDVEVKRITMVAFDSDGKLLFNNDDTAPELDDSKYTLYFKFADNYYENCTLYTIVNGDGDYSSISTINDIEQMKSVITDVEILSAKSEGVGFSSGRPSDDESEQILLFSPIYVSLQYAGVAKVVFDVVFDESIVEADRDILSFKINGELYTNTYIFNDSTESLDKATSVAVNIESLSCLVGGQSSMSSIEITLRGGYRYDISLSNDTILDSGKLYTYSVMLNAKSATNYGTTVEDSNTSSGDTSIGFSTDTGGATK